MARVCSGIRAPSNLTQHYGSCPEHQWHAVQWRRVSTQCRITAHAAHDTRLSLQRQEDDLANMTQLSNLIHSLRRNRNPDGLEVTKIHRASITTVDIGVRRQSGISLKCTFWDKLNIGRYIIVYIELPSDYNHLPSIPGLVEMWKNVSKEQIKKLKKKTHEEWIIINTD